jgi:hypothetical protein
VNYRPSLFAAISNQPEEDYISNNSFDFFDENDPAIDENEPAIGENDPAIEGSSLTIY